MGDIGSAIAAKKEQFETWMKSQSAPVRDVRRRRGRSLTRDASNGDRGAVSRVAARSFARAASARGGMVAACGACGVET